MNNNIYEKMMTNNEIILNKIYKNSKLDKMSFYDSYIIDTEDMINLMTSMIMITESIKDLICCDFIEEDDINYLFDIKLYPDFEYYYISTSDNIILRKHIFDNILEMLNTIQLEWCLELDAYESANNIKKFKDEFVIRYYSTTIVKNKNK